MLCWSLTDLQAGRRLQFTDQGIYSIYSVCVREYPCQPPTPQIDLIRDGKRAEQIVRARGKEMRCLKPKVVI